MSGRESRGSEGGCSGNAETEAAFRKVASKMHRAWQNLKANTKNFKLISAVVQLCRWGRRVRGATAIRFLDRNVYKW